MLTSQELEHLVKEILVGQDHLVVTGLLVVEEEKVEVVVMHQITLMLVMVVQDING